MQPITLTLAGREVSGHAGMTILELARESGVDIPTLCDDPDLNPAGACRLCLVEDERSGRLLASCVTPIESGMVINPTSTRVLERRKLMVELILASHPDSCFVCDKGNRCQLRRIASDMGIGLVRLEKIPQPAVIEEVNPFIERDLSKCILCAKCIRADHELVVQGAIDYFSRGFASKPATLNDMPLDTSDCLFCGTCVALCPTGALSEKEKTFRGTTTTSVTTLCPFCGCGCSIRLEVNGDRIVRAGPAGDGTINRRTLCVRGSYGFDFVHSPERLTSPLRRVNGGFEQVSWDQALDLIAGEFKRIRETYGPDSLAVLGSSKCTNEENYLLQRFARTALGTNNIDNGSRLYSSASRVGLGWTVGSPGGTCPLDELEFSGTIMVIGANPVVSAPLVGYAIKRAVRFKGAKLLIVDPQETGLSPFAHLWLKPRPGTDVALLNGMAQVIVSEGILDEEFVARRTDDFKALRRILAKYTPAYVQELTGVPALEVREAARLFAAAEQASIVYGNGITQRVTGTDGVMALANLAMLTGNIGRTGCGIYALQRDSNGQGACDMGALPDFLPGYQSVDDGRARKKFEKHWGVSLPGNTGLTALEMVREAGEGRIRAMYVVGENPALSFPHLNAVRESLANLDFLVVEDLFLTETAKLAKIVLPAASFAEKDGTFTNFEGRVQRLSRVIKPRALPDGEIILRLAEKMNSPMTYPSTQHVTDEIEELVPLYRGTGHADPETKTGGLESRRLYGGQFPKGFCRFSPVEYNPPLNTREEEYPLTLTVGTTLYHHGSGSRTSRAMRLKKFQPEAFVEMSEIDAERLGIKDGDTVSVISPQGRVTVRAHIMDTATAGTVFIPLSFPDSPVYELLDITLDPRSKIPSVKSCSVRLERTDSHE